MKEMRFCYADHKALIDTRPEYLRERKNARLVKARVKAVPFKCEKYLARLNIHKPGEELDQVLSALAEMYELQVQIYRWFTKAQPFEENLEAIFRQHFGNAYGKLALDDPDRKNKLDSIVKEMREWNTRQENREMREYGSEEDRERHRQAILSMASDGML